MTAPRVLHLVHTPGPGGTEQVALDLLRCIPESSAIQALAAPEGVLGSSAQEFGIQFYPVPFQAVSHSLSPLGLLSSLVLLPSLHLRMRETIHSFSPDIIHAHGAKVAILAGLLRWRNRRRRLIWHLHDYIPLGASRAVLIRLALLAADMVAAVSEDVARTVCGDKDVKIIPNSIALPASGRECAEHSLRDSLGLPSDCHVIGYAGRLDPEKGIGTLLECCALLFGDIPGARLLLAGDSPFRPQEMLKNWKNEASRLGISSQTIFLGRLEGLEEFFRSIDLFVLPAPREPFGLVVLEALARGIPVVACNSGGPKDILSCLQGSLLVEPDNPKTMAEACSELLMGNSRRAIAEREGPALVTANYSPEVQVGRVCSMYAEVLAS